MLLPYKILLKYSNNHYVFKHNDLDIISAYDSMIQPIKGIKIRIFETKKFPLKGTVISHFKNNDSMLTITTVIDDHIYVIYAVNHINEYHWLDNDTSMWVDMPNHKDTLDEIKLFFKYKIRKDKIEKLLS